MGKRYWVPAIERANLVLSLIAEKPGELRLIDLSNQLNIHKSSMFSILHTLEELDWVVKKQGDTYSLGHSVATLSAAYFKQFRILQAFYSEAAKSSMKINETIQLGILDGSSVFYLGKEEGGTRVRIATDPGMHFPAHASAIGKIQLSQYSYNELKALYPDGILESKTPNTITDLDILWKQLVEAKKKGFVTECEEGTLDFYCVAAPIYNFENKLIAGVSFSMIRTSWEKKREEATKEIVDLAERISLLAGKTSDDPKHAHS